MFEFAHTAFSGAVFTDRAGVHPRPQPKTAHMDFGQIGEGSHGLPIP